MLKDKESAVTMKRLLFLHIAKTAGTSVLRYLSDHIPARQIMSHGDFLHLPGQHISPETAANYQVISGHFGFSQVSHLADDCNLVTILRNPVERVLSFYQFCLHPNMQTRFPVARAAANLGVDGFFSSTLPEVTEVLDNQQTWQLAASYWYRDRQMRRNWRDEDVLENAGANLEKFAVIGITENFSNDFKRIVELTGLPDPDNIPHQLKTPQQLAPFNLSTETMDIINERLVLDLSLYENIKASFPEPSES